MEQVYTMCTNSLVLLYNYINVHARVLFLLQYADSTQVVVTSSNAAALTIVNSVFFGSSNQVAVVCILYTGNLY